MGRKKFTKSFKMEAVYDIVLDHFMERHMRTHIIAFISACLISATSSAQQQQPAVGCDYGTAHPNSPVELAQFAFLIGDYRIHLHVWQKDKWSLPQPGSTARWNGRYGLQGMVIIDEWFHPHPGQDSNASRGINVRIYDSTEKVWKMMWIGTAGKTVQDLRAELRDGTLTMWQVHPDRPNFKAIFNVLDGDHWERISFTHDDEGNWVRQFRLAATRIDCD
jgi:hypothetical protein